MDFRQLDAQLGRWTSMDPITHWGQSPYTGMDHNPVVFSDPLGLSTGDYDTNYITEKGEILASTDDGLNGVTEIVQDENIAEFKIWHQEGELVGVSGMRSWNNILRRIATAASKGSESSQENQDEAQDVSSEDLVGTSGAARDVAPSSPVAQSDQSGSTGLNTQIVSSTVSTAIWTSNTALGAASTYTVVSGKYYKWNELWHKTKTAGTAWRWQSRWNQGVAPAHRATQIKTVTGARKLASKLGKASALFLAADIAMSGELKPSHAINTFMLGASMTGVGSILSGAWFLADFGTMGINYLLNGKARGLGDMLDESIGTFEMYEGLY